MSKIVLLPCLASLLIGWGAATTVQQANFQEDDQLSDDELQLVETDKLFSLTTHLDGSGWEGYQQFLHPDFNRWSAGQETWDRSRTIDAIRQWWDEGNRMASSDTERLSVHVVENTGVIRKKVTETYVDKNGNETGSFTGFATQVWIRQSGDWKLLAVSLQVESTQAGR